MTVNPFVALFERPVETLTAAAYAVVLLSALVATWYALGRSALAMDATFRDGWLYLPDLGWTLRAVGALLIVAVDLLLVAGIVHVLT